MKKILSILLIGLLAFAGSCWVGLSHGLPQAHVHDEFSYLLAADTFDHGRLTNPTHPMWEHFETFHELMQPSYMSKYPPAQGFFLALGKIFFKSPIFGVWMSDGLMCAAICWMLYAWVSPSWALIGGWVAVIEFGVFTYWSQSYWGGAVAAMGGALVFGAIPRIIKFHRTRDVLWLSLGVFTLVNSRPIEGVLLGIPVCLFLLPNEIKGDTIPSPQWFKKIVIPLLVCLIFIFGFTGYYNKQLTGHVLVFPHQIYDKEYFSVPLFIWQPLKPDPVYHHQIMEGYDHEWIRKYFLEKKTWHGFWADLKNDIEQFFNFYFGYPLAVAALMILVIFNLNTLRKFSILMVFMIFLATFASTYCRLRPHYYAPFTGVFILLVVEGLIILSRMVLGKFRVGILFVISLLIFQTVFTILTYRPNLTGVSKAGMVTVTPINFPPSFTREQISRILRKEGGKYLVIVRYPPWHQFQWEWVYNDADIDASRIVWARDMGGEKNKELINYFKDRQLLVIKINQESSRAGRYDAR